MYDMNLNFLYFYENNILNNESLSKVFENKMNYIYLIILFFKEIKIASINIGIIDIPPDTYHF